MTEVATPGTTRPVGRVRTVAGIVVGLLVLGVAVAFLLGMLNPWELVVLKRHLGNTWVGLALVAAGSYVVAWLLVPIRNEARQGGWIGLRVLLAAVTVGGLVTGGVLGPQFRYQPSVVAQTPDGERTVALTIVGGLEERQLLVWQGAGLAAREVGSFGRPCTGIEVRFITRDVLVLNQGFGDWRVRLDPRTGQPLHRLPLRCSEPPVPVTLGP